MKSTNTHWTARLTQIATRANLSFEARAELQAFLESQVFAAHIPSQIGDMFAGELLERAVLDAKDHGVAVAVAKLHLVLGLILVTASSVSLERLGLVGPSVPSSLEFALGQVLPEVPPMHSHALRVRLRCALEPSLPVITA
jgi:hypothetical protein